MLGRTAGMSVPTDRRRCPKFGRRRVIAGVLTASTLGLIPWATAGQATDPRRAEFLRLSAFLVGRTPLDRTLGDRLFDNLTANDLAFSMRVTALSRLIEEQSLTPDQLQGRLDRDRPDLAPLPRTIMIAWCLGLTGAGDKARCIAFEKAMNAVMVADVLKPPTYAYGAYGSWTAPPPMVRT